MTRALRLRPEAESDLTVTAYWYQRQSPGLGHRFLDEVLKALDAIGRTPQLYPIVHRKIRRALIRRFPFGVFYRIESEQIVVLAVMHASRAPERWKDRA